jgi:hypothetical protein
MDSGVQTAAAVGPQGSNENFSGVIAGKKLIAIAIYGQIIGVVGPRRLNVASPLTGGEGN